MMDAAHGLPVTQQAKLLALSRSSVYYRPAPRPEADLARIRRIDELHLEHPFAGSRMLRDMRQAEGQAVGHKHDLAVVLDWATRRVLSWRLSNTLTSDFCVEALEDAIARYGSPEIMNTDQGSQFTSSEFIGTLEANEIAIGMGGNGCWRDNVFIERLCKSIKYDGFDPVR